MYSADDIYQLMTEKLAGVISAVDDEILGELIETHPQIRKTWETLSQAPAALPPAPWLNVVDFEEKRSIRRVILQWTAAAACLAIIVLAIKNWQRLMPATAPVKVSAMINKDVLLQLANKQIINLTQSPEIINIAGKQLHNKKNCLSFPASDNLPNGINSLVVPQGNNYQVILPDSSEIWLNAATQMDFPFSFKGNTREIVLNGEAYLKIAQNPQKPFIVHLPHSTIEVLGTSFNVNSYDNNVEKVSLVDGAIKMKAGKKTVIVKPGQQAIYQKNTKTIITQPFNEITELGWRKGLYSFTDTPLDELSKIISRWYGIRVTLDNDNIANEKFTGLLDKNTPISFLLEGIKATTKANYYYSADSTLHFK